MKKRRTAKRPAARSRRPQRPEILHVRLSAVEMKQLRQMADRADLTDAAFVRRMLATHARIEADLLRQRAELAAEEQRKLIEASSRDVASEIRKATAEESGVRTMATATAEAA